MGNVALCCGAESFEMTQRQELLKEGNDFKKKTSYLGGVLSKSEGIYLQLNPTATRLKWRVTSESNKWEEVSIHRIGKVCPNGHQELVILALNGQKLLELTAESVSVRDLWVQALEELCNSTNSSSDMSEKDTQSLQAELSKQVDKQKVKYWTDRTSSMEQRRIDAEARKQKLGLVGFKYTAQAMAKK